MKIFQNKSLFKKLIIIFLVITIFSFCMPKVSRADDLGGKLLNPIMSFFVALGDGTMTIIQKMVLQIDESVINIDTSSSFWAKFIVVIAAIAVVSVIVIATVMTAGAADAAMVGIATALKGITAAAIVIGTTTVTFPITTQIVEGMLPDSFILPLYEVTPQEIFSNKIPLLDVDFFNPMEDSTYTKAAETKKVKEDDTTTLRYKYIEEQLNKDYGFNKSSADSENSNEDNHLTNCPSSYTKYSWKKDGKKYVYAVSSDGTWYCERWHDGDGKDHEYLKVSQNDDGYGLKLTWSGDTKNLAWDTSGGVSEVSIEGEEKTVTVKDESSVTITSTAKELRTIVANWYNILRDIALVALLSVLVFVGIKILISSTSGEKAKYKQMLVDWLVAMCLLFLMQYIMSFSNMLVKKVIKVVDTTSVSATKATEVKEPNLFVITDKKKVQKAYEVLIGDKGGEDNPYYKYFLKSDYETPADSKGNAEALAWPAENFMQQARLNAQLREVKQDEDGNYDTDDVNETYVAIGWKLIYVVLVIYTVIFIFTYVKRVLYMAFLTIIAPLVAMTYPIDKINDGKAQAFDMWFKEYIFNLLIQPLHLILYTVLVGSAMEFASKNIIYVVVALGFLTPAEKLMRRFFGFEKAHTPGLLGGPAGAAIMMSGMNKLLGKRSDSKSSGSSSNGGSGDGDDDKSSLRFNDNFDKTGAILGKGSQDFQDKLEDNKEDQKLIDLQKRKEEAENEIKQNGAGKKETENDLISINSEMKKTNESKNGKVEQREGISKKDALQLSKWDNFKRTIKLGGKSSARAGRYFAYKKLSEVGKKIQNSHPGRTILKSYGGLAAGTAGVILGGIAGGDPTKAFQYGVAGATGGYKAMDAVLPEFRSDEDYKQANELRKETFYGDEYDQKKLEKYIKHQKQDYDNRVQIETALGSKKSADEFIKNDMGEYMKNGVTDIDEMMTLNSMVQDGTFTDRNMAIATRKYAKRAGSKIGNMKQKDQDEWHTTFAKEFRKNPRLKKENLDADKEADKVIKLTNTYFDRMNK